MAKAGILITDGNERSALAATRSLGEHGVPVYVGAESPRSLAGESRHCTSSFTYPSPYRDPEAYVECLIEAATKWNVAAVFPMTDIAMELFTERREEIEKIAKLPIPTSTQYHQLSDKYQLAMWAEEAGIPVPSTFFVPDGEVEPMIAQIKRWPVAIKPARSLLKAGGVWRKSRVLVAHDAADLRRAYHDHWFLKHPSMLQQYIAGHGEGVFGLFENGEPVSLFAHRRLRELPPSGGVSVLRESIPLTDPMAKYALQIMKAARWNGVAMVEFKVATRTNVPYLMEVNGRFWGSLQLAIDAGVDFPYMLYQRTAGQSDVITEHDRYQVGVRSRWWLGELDHLLALLRSQDDQSLPLQKIPRWRTFSSLIDVFDARTKNEILRSTDPRPGLFELGNYTRRKFSALWRGLAVRLSNRSHAVLNTFWNSALALGLHRRLLERRFPRQPKSVLVLCRGNICRSPFAEAWLRESAISRGLDFRFVSAGLEAVPGRTAFPVALSTAPRFSLDLSGHRARQISRDIVDDADVILVMEPEQARMLADAFPDAHAKTFVLGHFMSKNPKNVISDPYGGTADDFQRCFDVLVAAGEGFMAQMSAAEK